MASANLPKDLHSSRDLLLRKGLEPEIEETQLAQLDFFDSTLCLVKLWSTTCCICLPVYICIPVILGMRPLWLCQLYLRNWNHYIYITTNCFRHATRYPCHTIVSWLGIGSSSHPRGSETVCIFVFKFDSMFRVWSPECPRCFCKADSKIEASVSFTTWETSGKNGLETRRAPKYRPWEKKVCIIVWGCFFRSVCFFHGFICALHLHHLEAKT